METKRSLSRDEYTVGWIAALSIELGVARAMLDEEHEKPSDFIKPLTDQNAYTWGKIHKHNVVIASLPAGIPGKVSATSTALSMLSSFPQIRIGLLVGIGAGVPRLPERDIRLGDVVVSKPNGRDGGVVQHDSFKAKSDGEVESRHFLNSPPRALLSALSKLQGRHESQEPKFPDILSDTLKRHPRLKKRGYVYQGREKDKLYKTANSNEEIERETRDSDDPEVHYGTIASGDTLFKDAAYRDKVLSRLGDDCICIEMEAAGLMNDFPCIVIRGISDYADSHKNDVWQRYAAATAAAYAKELLYDVDCQDLQQTLRACDLENISEKLAEISSDTKAISTTLESMQKDSESEKIRGWLKPPDPSTNLNEARKKRLNGTGSWLLETELFRQWKSGSRQCLWLHGIPGCGKTVLSSTIIDHLNQESTGFVVLTFFFDFNDSEKQSLENLVRSLVVQLYSKCKNSRTGLEALEKSCGTHQQPALESLFEVFLEMVKSVGKIQIVIDALDECQERVALLSWMESFTRSSPKELRLLLTSRKEQDIEFGLMFWLDPASVVPIQQDSVNPDIRAYIRDRLQKDRGFARWNAQPSVRDEIETKLMRRADGMFRWAACQLDILQNCLDRRKLDKALESLPATLEETYARILANINEDYREEAIRILQFLTYSERPLTLEEAIDVLAVYPDEEPTFDSSARMPNPLEIQIVCSSLVSLVTRETYYGKIITELQLAHFSVQQYLKSERIGRSFPNEDAEVGMIFQNAMIEVSARGSITKLCLAYLSYLGEEITISADWNLFSNIQRAYSLVNLSATYWMDHAKFAETQQDVLERILNFFLRQQQAYHLWAQMFDAYKQGLRPFRGSIKTASPLYYASFAGLTHTVRYMLLNGSKINARGGLYQTALQAATAQNQKHIVKLLLESGADVNEDIRIWDTLPIERRRIHSLNAEAQNWTPLYLASRHGHVEMVRLLLDNKACMNTDQDRCPALRAASINGHTAIVQLLLKEGANPSFQDQGYDDTLHIVASRGHMEVLQLLLEKGIDVDNPSNHHSLLCAAANEGRKEIVRLLLSRGARISMLGWSALIAAAYGGHKETVQLLLDNGADVNFLADCYTTALQSASSQGESEVVQLLLNNGADINHLNGDNDTSLAAAVLHGHTDTVRVLLRNGADARIKSGDSSLLEVARRQGRQEIMRLLVCYGAG
ncbi:hypothetical protein FQN50_008858 [Emmonsiellopsis sp. PD_5]|nr:hypothetical protein FQN50_008858 [Emmonsiellopsis sp. PD_5]